MRAVPVARPTIRSGCSGSTSCSNGSTSRIPRPRTRGAGRAGRGGRRDARGPSFFRPTTRTKRIARSSPRVGGSAEARLRGRWAALSSLWRTDEAGSPPPQSRAWPAESSSVWRCLLGLRRLRSRTSSIRGPSHPTARPRRHPRPRNRIRASNSTRRCPRTGPRRRILIAGRGGSSSSRATAMENARTRNGDPAGVDG